MGIMLYMLRITSKRICKMTNSLSKRQKAVLDSLAIHGSQNIKTIQQKEGLNYATTHRSIKILEEKGLVWMSHRDVTRGPKGATEYSLTPFGVVESVLRCGSDDIEKTLKHWERIAPRYIRFWENWKAAGILDYIKTILQDIYPDIVTKHRDTETVKEKIKSNIYSDKINIVYRNILDTILINEVFKKTLSTDLEKVETFYKLLSEDLQYREVLDRWYQGQKFIFQFLTNLINGTRASERKKPFMRVRQNN